MPDINLNQLKEVAQQQQNADFTIDTKTGDLRVDSRQNPFQRAISWVREKFTSEATLKMERHGAYNLFLRAMSQHSGFNDADVARVTGKISAAVIGNKPLSARHIIQILNEIEAEQSSSQAKESPEEGKPLEARKSSEASVPKKTRSYANNLAKVQAESQESKPVEDQVEELATLPKPEKRTRYTPTQEQKDFSFEKDRATNYAKARSAEAEKLKPKTSQVAVEKQVQNAAVSPEPHADTPAVKTSEGNPLAFQDV
ncbi:MAG: hypothetical protein ACNYNY_05520, partial [Candidatus Oxydemutatoraceae bacterium WSBS_2016_MAG_OTU14]